MAVQIVNTRTEAQLHGVKALIYGSAGVGKTSLALSMDTPIILSAESGVLSLRNYDLPMIKIKTVLDLTEAYSWLTTSAQAKQFNTVFIDSITEIAEQVLANAKSLVKDPRMAYNTLLDQMIPIVKSFRDLPGKHVIMSAKEEMTKNEVGQFHSGPMMPGTKVGMQLPYLFDEVFRMGINKDASGKSYRFFQTQPDQQFEAKDRSGCLDFMEQPNINHVISKILSGAK
jgi:hypothetical protein